MQEAYRRRKSVCLDGRTRRLDSLFPPFRIQTCEVMDDSTEITNQWSVEEKYECGEVYSVEILVSFDVGIFSRTARSGFGRAGPETRNDDLDPQNGKRPDARAGAVRREGTRRHAEGIDSQTGFAHHRSADSGRRQHH